MLASSTSVATKAEGTKHIDPGHERHAFELGERIAGIAAGLHAATYELLVLLREFDACAGWNNGCLSCAHWLHWRTGIDLGAAREKVRVARALAGLPRISEAMQLGALSYAKVRAITRVATPDNEVRLLDLALAATAAQVERLVRAWRKADRLEAAQQTELRHQQRSVTLHVDDDGMVILRGRLTPEIGAVVQRALEAAADHLFQESAHASGGVRISDEVTPAQRRADALGLLAECALAGGLDRGTAGDRYQVVLHVDTAGLQSAERDASLAPDDGQAVVESNDGATDVSEETSRRLSCDASLVIMRHGADGTLLDVGRRTRTIPAAIRRALLARDRRCQFPGCTARRCDGHHIRHWADGGPTCLDNLTLLCRRHHRAVHEEGFAVVRAAGGDLVFYRPDGRPIETAPARPRLEDGGNGLGWAASGRFPITDEVAGRLTRTSWAESGSFDVGWALDVLRPGGRLPKTTSDQSEELVRFRIPVFDPSSERRAPSDNGPL